MEVQSTSTSNGPIDYWHLVDLLEKDVLLVEEENTARMVEEGVVHHLLEQVNALPHPEHPNVNHLLEQVNALPHPEQCEHPNVHTCLNR